MSHDSHMKGRLSYCKSRLLDDNQTIVVTCEQYHIIFSWFVFYKFCEESDNPHFGNSLLSVYENQV